MLKTLFLTCLLVSLVPNAMAQRSEILKVTVGEPIVITDDEVAECTLGQEDKKSICTMIIKSNKKLYIAYLEQGYPDIPPLTEREIYSCTRMEKRFQFKCNTTLIKGRLDYEKNEYLKKKGRKP